MKRSDVLVRLEKLLDIKYVDEYLYNASHAKDILSLVEQLGMLPPRTKLKGLDLEDNAWEPEDEN